jgi:hypothetical protein
LLDFLTDQHFLEALAVLVGPLVFFAAPTKEIEHLVLGTQESFDQAPEPSHQVEARVTDLSRAA